MMHAGSGNISIYLEPNSRYGHRFYGVATSENKNLSERNVRHMEPWRPGIVRPAITLSTGSNSSEVQIMGPHIG